MANFIFSPHAGMCPGCHERWSKSPEAVAVSELTGKFREELKSLVERHREKIDPKRS